MKHHYRWLVFVVILATFALWVSIPGNEGVSFDFNGDDEPDFTLNVYESLGLDIIGGLRVLLRADLPSDAYTRDELQEAANNVSRRVNGLGLSEATIQLQGDTRILVELPGIVDEIQARQTIQQTALLEFVNFAGIDSSTIATYEGQPVLTTEQVRIEEQRQRALEEQGEEATGEDEEATEALTDPTSVALTTIGTLATQLMPEGVNLLPPLTRAGPLRDDGEGQPPFETVMTGDGLSAAAAERDPTSGQWLIRFELTDEGGDVFGPFTGSNVGQPMAIILDGILLSAPTIQDALPTGGVISGQFTEDEAKQLALQLRSGALPIPLSVESFSRVGATLGQESVELSIRAGIVGVIIVLTFMLFYYRLPGLAADLALLVFIVLNLAIFKLLPVTLTLPAITGFLISIGTAVDGNILIFERLKEELRDGKDLQSALDAGFDRAWTSIRDSNISTIIICGILFFFGQTPGASIVSGFAITLAIGLVLNLFTAVLVTRTFLYVIVGLGSGAIAERKWLLGT
jgi:protein-export membrane protein SecD